MTFRYQEFTSPGTWTNPGSVTQVQVTVVGGGGGANPSSPFLSTPVNGSGGGFRKEWVPVSGPMPVTIGAGGTGGPNPTVTNGGTSAFGPLGPGPVPEIPAGTVAAGGGAGGAKQIPNPERPIAGGGSYAGTTYYLGGGYGQPGLTGGSGGKGTAIVTAYTSYFWGEEYFANSGWGAGPSTSPGQNVIVYGTPAPTSPVQFGAPAPACANTGSGGAGSQPGSAGIVIVRWFE